MVRYCRDVAKSEVNLSGKLDKKFDVCSLKVMLKTWQCNLNNTVTIWIQWTFIGIQVTLTATEVVSCIYVKLHIS
jgi:hypothetical protein